MLYAVIGLLATVCSSCSCIRSCCCSCDCVAVAVASSHPPGYAQPGFQCGSESDSITIALQNMKALNVDFILVSSYAEAGASNMPFYNKEANNNASDH